MKKDMRRNPLALWIATFAVCLLIFFGIQRAYRPPRDAAQILPELSVTFPSGTTKDVSSPWYYGGIKNCDFVPGIYTASMSLPLSGRAEAMRDTDDYVLVFPSVDGNALRVFFNGQFLGSQGDFAHGNSNIWYPAKFFAVPTSLVAEHNTITADIYGSYEAGISHPPYLVRKTGNMLHLAWLFFVTRGLVIFLTGAILLLGFVVIFTGFGEISQTNSRVMLGLASLLTALFLTDFMNLEYLPITLLAFKKIVAIARHGAAIVFLIGFLKLLERKQDLFSKLFIVIQALCSLALLYPPSVSMLKRFYTFTYLTIAPMPLYLLYFLFSKRPQKQEYSILIVGVIFATLTCIRDVALPLLRPGAIWYSHYGFMILIISAAWFIVLDDMNHFRLFMIEKTISEQYRHESLHDPLTGVYNRSMLELARRELPADFSIIILDIDDLKAINDTHGHLAGDDALRSLASRIQNLVRYDDMTIRYGGDEFLVILPHCPAERLASIVDTFNAEFSKCEVAMNDGRVFTYSVSIGSTCASPNEKSGPRSFDEAVAQADERMYAEKRRKKATMS